MQGEDGAWSQNPFDCDASQTTDAGSQETGRSMLTDIDSKLEAFSTDYLWQDSGDTISSRYNIACGKDLAAQAVGSACLPTKHVWTKTTMQSVAVRHSKGGLGMGRNPSVA